MIRKISDFAEDAFKEILANFKQEVKPIPTTSVPELGRQLNGGWFTGLVAIVGPAGTGKTQLSLQATLDAIRSGTPALYFGLEMSAIEFVARMLGLISRVPWSEILRGKLDGIQLERCKTAFNELIQLPLYYEEGKPEGFPYNHTGSLAAAMRNLYPDGHIMLVIDYLQILAGDARDDIRERIRKAAYFFKAISRDRKMVVLCLSSTARSNYGELNNGDKSIGKGDPSKLLGTGKESGEIEYAADVVLVLARQGADVMEGVAPIQIAIAKLRAGQRKWIPMRFYDGTRFEYDADPDIIIEISDGNRDSRVQKQKPVQLDPNDKKRL